MKNIAIITGASSGIGASFVKEISANESYFDEIWVVARREEKLLALKEELKDDRIVPVTADLASPDGVGEIEDKLTAEKPAVGLLVNCAGLGKRALVEEQSLKALGDTLDVNCKALTLLTRIAIPYMTVKEASFGGKGAGIINVASSAAFLPQPGFTVYAASKSYVTSFSRALAMELYGDGIRVTAVCPGPVNTEFQVNATDGKTTEFTGFRKLLAADPDKLAKASVKACRSGRYLFVYGISQKLLHIASKIVPTYWIISMMKVKK